VASITDTCNHHWGEYVSASIDPTDNVTFWAAGQHLAQTEDICHGVEGTCGTADYSHCYWKTAVFTCKKGSGFCM
jgi:hypothetical protein